MSSATANSNYRTNDSPGLTTYWRVSGIALAAVAGLGIILNAISAGALLGNFLTFDWTHNIVHVLLAVVALGVGFGVKDVGVKRTLAKIVGIVYLGLGIVGFLSATIFGIGTMLGLHLELGENLVHLVLGAWGTYVGFAD